MKNIKRDEFVIDCKLKKTQTLIEFKFKLAAILGVLVIY
jgi:hypothetical protein